MSKKNIKSVGTVVSHTRYKSGPARINSFPRRQGSAPAATWPRRRPALEYMDVWYYAVVRYTFTYKLYTSIKSYVYYIYDEIPKQQQEITNVEILLFAEAVSLSYLKQYDI